MDYVPICSAHRLPIKQWGLHAALMWSAMLLCDSRKIAVYEAVGVTRPPNATCFCFVGKKRASLAVSFWVFLQRKLCSCPCFLPPVYLVHAV